MPIPNTQCSWEFNSTIHREGQLNTPDYRVDGNILCDYQFYGMKDELVELEIVFNKLRYFKIFALYYVLDNYYQLLLFSNNYK